MISGRDRKKLFDEFVEMRNVQTPCPECGGTGVKNYPNTATYHRNISLAGQAFTADVCDECWGSGDAHNKWPSHIEFEEMRFRLESLEK